MKQVIIIFGIFFFAQVLPGQPNIIFSDGFETGELDPDFWTARPNLTGSDGIVDISTNAAAEGQFGVRMGKTTDTPGQFTRNALDLKVDLSGQQRIMLEFFIRSFADETHLGEDGIWLSDDGGENFILAYQFDPATWCSYGLHPPIDISKLAAQHELSLNEDFVIRFQQYDDANFSTRNDEDGFYMDGIQLYDPNIEYAELPFSEDFETGMLSSALAWSSADSTILPATGAVKPSNRRGVLAGQGINSSFGVIMGSLCDQAANFTVNALDLHLDLATEDDVVLEFWIEDFGDETHIQDGVYFSDDAGNTFVKVWDFDPGQWCNGYGWHPPLDVDFLASQYGLELTNRFVIRFQQYDDADFNTRNDEDGFKLDEIQVYAPSTQYVQLPLFDDFETGVLDPYWRWKSAEATALPAEGAVKPTNRRQVLAGQGINSSFGVIMGKRCDETANFTVNALDLHLNLAGEDDVVLEFWINDFGDETHIQDGLYFSDDGGVKFVKVWDFNPEQWCNSYGWHPPLDVDFLASKYGLELTEQFVIRWQQYDDADFNTRNDEDGIKLDEVHVYNPGTQYATLPFFDDFETGTLSAFWRWRTADSTALPTLNTTKPTSRRGISPTGGLNNSFAPFMGKNCDESANFNSNALDLHLNLAGADSVELRFFFRDFGDENHIQDGVFLSVDNGRSFSKIYTFDFESLPNSFSELSLDIVALADSSGLALSDSTIIRFQQFDDADFSGTGDEDGLFIDNVSVTGQLSTSIANVENSPKIKLFPNPTSESVTISLPETFDLQNTQYQLMDLQGKVLRSGVIQHDFFLVNLSELPEGIYVLRLKTDEGVFQQKFMKVTNR